MPLGVFSLADLIGISHPALQADARAKTILDLAVDIPGARFSLVASQHLETWWHVFITSQLRASPATAQNLLF